MIRVRLECMLIETDLSNIIRTALNPPCTFSAFCSFNRGMVSSPSIRAAPGEPFGEAVKRLGVKFVLFSWTDLFGVMRSKMVSFSFSLCSTVTLSLSYLSLQRCVRTSSCEIA